MRKDGISRRGFLAASTAGAGLAAVSFPQQKGAGDQIPRQPARIDLTPARWLWYPSGRCLPNTFVLFRREFTLSSRPKSAKGWISADSRYLLHVNGRRVQWGPAPADPRWPDADPIDLAGFLQSGNNVLAATVLYYGSGDGTSPIGKPGFIFRLDVEEADGSRQVISSDDKWLARLARSWPPGQHRRWFLRALQENFDARLYPHGWDSPGHSVDGDWLPALMLDCPADKPALCSTYPDYSMEGRGDRAVCFLRPRQIPPMREAEIQALRLADSFGMEWKRTPQEYFECRTPGAYTIDRRPAAQSDGPGRWRVHAGGAACLTFEFEEQIVGWPFFTIDAAEGTVVELLIQESHSPDGPPLLDTHHHSWSRFTCREGVNRFETFDYESLRWLQLHIRNAARELIVRDVGMRRRIYPWPHAPSIVTSEPVLNRLLGASVNTLHNSAQEHIVDGMGRERQQYSGDCGHQIHAIYFAFGETRQPARYLRTFSEGMTLDGYFLDCWPAFDRLARLMERQVNMTGWGPILDHGIGFNFDCWHHYLYTGDLEAVHEPYTRLVRFFEYLGRLRGRDGLLPVENLGVPSVWIDHQAYRKQSHKQCAFNLYAVAMLRHAFAPLALALGDLARARSAGLLADQIFSAASASFWDERRGLFVVNRPWLREEKGARLCDRSLATAILYGLCPGGNIQAARQALAETPAEMGFSYPANAGWRLWALARCGRIDVVLRELRQRWGTLPSVIQNNSIQEDWIARPDSGAQWSHCAVVPLYVFYMNVAGIRPLSPGFSRCEIRPQPGDLKELRLVAQTVRGPIRFETSLDGSTRNYRLEAPAGCDTSLLLPASGKTELARADWGPVGGLTRYLIPSGRAVEFSIRE